MTTDLITEARNAAVPEMLEILKQQRSRRLDLIVPADRLRFVEGQLVLTGLDMIRKYEDIGGGEQILLEEFDPNGPYRPTAVFDEHIATRFNIGLKYVRLMRETRPDLYDANVNGWIKGRPAKMRPASQAELDAGDFEVIADGDDLHSVKVLRPGVRPDSRMFTVRLYRGDEGAEGIARALLSNRYAPLDNLDGLMALLKGLEQAGIELKNVEFTRVDLTERGLHVRAAVPEIKAMAPHLAGGYRNPFAQQGVERAGGAVRGHELEQWRKIAQREGMAYTEEEGGEPVVFAGFDFDNSEVGGGLYSLRPTVTVQICKNGLTMPAFATEKRHVGARLDEGVRWGADTQEANLDVIIKTTRDLVAQFLDPEFFGERVQELEHLAGAELANPTQAVQEVAQHCKFSEAEVEGIMAMFTRGGQMTAGGVANAITAYSQTVENPEAAAALDERAVKAMAYAAR